MGVLEVLRGTESANLHLAPKSRGGIYGREAIAKLSFWVLVLQSAGFYSALR